MIGRCGVVGHARPHVSLGTGRVPCRQNVLGAGAGLGRPALDFLDQIQVPGERRLTDDEGQQEPLQGSAILPGARGECVPYILGYVADLQCNYACILHALLSS